MTNTTCCTIKLLNKNYKIKCPVEEIDNLQYAALRLNDQLLKEKSNSTRLDEYQVLLMAALRVSHELVMRQQQQAEQTQQLATFIQAFENKINTEKV